MSFMALVLTSKGDRQVEARVQELKEDDLPAADVTVAVTHSTVNYKDGLCLSGGGGLVRNYPHVAGIDFAGTVCASNDHRYREGDSVILTGWRVGEAWWGGYSQRARVKPEWLVPLPKGWRAQDAMAFGTAGLTAMLGVMDLEASGLTPEGGAVLVTGAAGGVGSVGVAVLARLGYAVVAATRRVEDVHDELIALGAQKVISSHELTTPNPKPLESETWAGCLDSVGGVMLARVLAQLRYRGAVAAIGLAGGVPLATTVIPFLLRGARLLGIDSVLRPFADRCAAWQRLAQIFTPEEIARLVTREISLAQVPEVGAQIIRGEGRGRVVVRLDAS